MKNFELKPSELGDLSLFIAKRVERISFSVIALEKSLALLEEITTSIGIS